MAKGNSKPLLILLDVYGTLLRMDEVEKKINLLMGSRLGYTIWFELFMQYCFVDNCIVQFNNFPSIAGATLQMTGEMLKKAVSHQEIQQVLDLLTQLPVHDGVQEGLSALHDRGIRIAALTNSPEATVCERMERTGLISYFEQVLSAEHVGKYKPSLAVYQWAAATLQLKPSEIMLVSTHGWDLAGGANAAMRISYLRQSKQMLYPLAPHPEFVCNNLEDLAAQLDL